MNILVNVMRLTVKIEHYSPLYDLSEECDVYTFFCKQYVIVVSESQLRELKLRK